MKIPSLILAFSLFVPLSLSCGGREKTQGRLLSYEYTYHGPMFRSGNYYKIEAGEDGSVRVFISEGGWGSETRVYSAPAEALATVEKMVADGRLRRLKAHYKTPFRVLDGWDWNLYIRHEKGSISSGGYMAHPPKALYEAMEAIGAYIRALAVEENFLEIKTE